MVLLNDSEGRKRLGILVDREDTTLQTHDREGRVRILLQTDNFYGHSSIQIGDQDGKALFHAPR